jgi:cytochrome c2
MKPGSVALIWASVAGLALALGASAATAADVKQGQATFRAQCGLCHVGGPGDGDGGQGPPLAGVVGRKAASAPGFPYTPALKASGLTWTPQTLDRFLTDPAKLVPGTAMPISVPDAKTRQDLIAYLATLHAH